MRSCEVVAARVITVASGLGRVRSRGRTRGGSDDMTHKGFPHKCQHRVCTGDIIEPCSVKSADGPA